MKAMKKALYGAAAATAILGLSACGGSNPTRAGYARALNQVCARANATIKTWGSTRTLGEAEALFADVRHGRVQATSTELEHLYGKAVESYRKITPPTGERETARQFLDTAVELQAALKRAIDLADSGDQSAFEDADRELSSLGTEAGGLARRLGAQSCAPA
jgi:hypothetical protein